MINLKIQSQYDPFLMMFQSFQDTFSVDTDHESFLPYMATYVAYCYFKALKKI